jgi:equilibrative nucleoside transporter 1/2/3
MNSPLPRTPLSTLKKQYYDQSFPIETTADILAEIEEEKTIEEEKEEQMACILFALVGIGYLFPFSALTQPIDYWKMLFPDFNIEFTLTSTFMYTNLLFLDMIVLCTKQQPWYTGRIVGGFMGQLIVLSFVPTSYFFLTSESSNAIAVLGGTAAVAIATAFIDSSTIALVSHFPLRVQESFQLGVGLSTLIGSIYRDVTKFVFPSNQLVASTLIYFYTGAITIALCIGAYYKLMRMKMTKKCLNLKTGDNNTNTINEDEESGVELTERSPLLVQQQSNARSSSPPGLKSSGLSKWFVLKKIWFLELLVTFVFISTLSLWPPLMTEIKSYQFPYLQSNGWYSLILLTIFSIWDCVGRFMVRYRFGLTSQNIWLPVLLRLVLIPIFIGIVQQKIFQHDAWSILFVSILGHTNGYLGTMTIIFVNESVNHQEMSIAGSFTSFFLNTGLVLGASAGLLMEKIVLSP